MDISQFTKENKPYKYLLNIIDVFSRYVWVYPISSKSPEKVVPLIILTVNEIKEKHPSAIIIFTSDSGSEFINKKMTEYTKENNIRHYTIVSKNNRYPTRTAIIERYNRSLWVLISKYCTSHNTLHFIDKLPNFTSNYNNKIHTTIKCKPYDVYYNNELPLSTGQKIVKLKNKVGDIVRIIHQIKKFDKKSFEPKYSIQTYEIVNIIDNKYELKNLKSGVTLKKLFLERELLLTNDVEKNDTTIDPNNLTYDQKLGKAKHFNRFIKRQKREPAFKGSKFDDEGNVILHRSLKPK